MPSFALVRGRRFPLAVVALVIANLATYALELRASDPDAFINAFAAIPYDIVQQVTLPPPSPPFAPLTLVTAMFLHASAVHIGANMLFLIAFGPAVERICGGARFAALYLACGIIGGVMQVAINPGSHVPGIGASGAIAGILGAYIVRFPIADLGRFAVIAGWAALQFVHGFGVLSQHGAGDTGGTAYFAHIGGFAAGVTAMGAFARWFTIE